MDMILLDDGEFYIELNGSYPAASAPGFLQRRCRVGLTAPDGYECVGSFGKTVAGRWKADVSAPLDEKTDSDCLFLGVFEARMNAIAALWQRRHEALLRR